MARYWLEWVNPVGKAVKCPYSDLDVFARDAEAFLRTTDRIVFSVPKYEDVAILKIQDVFNRLGRSMYLHKDSDKDILEYVSRVSLAASTAGLAGSAVAGTVSLLHQGGPIAVKEYLQATAANASATFWNALAAVWPHAASATGTAIKTASVFPDPTTVVVAAAASGAFSAFRKYREIRMEVRATLSPMRQGYWDLEATRVPFSVWGLVGL
jgi:hypothetical protein